MQNNQVILSGKFDSGFEFSHSNHHENFYKAILSVSRQSGTVDNVPILVSDRIADINNDYTKDKIHIDGQIRTYNTADGQLLMNILANHISRTEEPDADQVSLDGFICNVPKVRSTPLGRKIADCIIAVNRNYGKSDYIPCIFWGRNAAYISRLMVGNEIHLDGRIQSREYIKMVDDIKSIRTAYEVSVIDCE